MSIIRDYKAVSRTVYEQPNQENLEQLLIRCQRAGDSTNILAVLHGALIKAWKEVEALSDRSRWPNDTEWTEAFLNATCSMYRAQGALAVALAFVESKQDPDRGLLSLRIEGVIETIRRAASEGKMGFPHPEEFNAMTIIKMLLGEPSRDGVLPLPRVGTPAKSKKLVLRKRKQ